MPRNGDDREERGYRVRGRVQGVGFRWWARGIAESLEIGGTVRNLVDGSVEVRACGRAKDLDELEEKLREGPRFSHVDSVELFEAGPISHPDEFRVER